MIRLKNYIPTLPVIDLDSEYGNAFGLIALAEKLARGDGWKSEDINVMRKSMMSSHYHDLLYMFEEFFGDKVILETNDESLIDRVFEELPESEEWRDICE